MPTYEYECRKCGNRFDVFQGMTEPPKKRCPKCKGRVDRLLSTGGGFLFKGTGFYSTDYRSDGYKKAAKADSDGAAKPSGDKASAKKETTGSGSAKTAAD
jgi:putative FmdB family regulatory protein